MIGRLLYIRRISLDRQSHVEMDQRQRYPVFLEPVRESRQPEPTAIDSRNIDRMILGGLLV
ncbi:hypothetical protein [Bradyrhizobium centrolobii]|uniref:hypothetical protein n=1 Tax=Bradyrhizobium centrolobii TaxID=1505087 RepID=UPI003221E242